MKNKLKQRSLILLTWGLVLWVGCISKPSDPVFDNPFDSDGINYIPPEITKIGATTNGDTVSITNGDIVTSRNLTIYWKGNPDSIRYRYSIDGDSLLDWTESNSLALSDLEEGTHIFAVKSTNNIEESPWETRTFIVRYIQPPGIVFSPRKITGDSNITVRLLLDVEHLMGAHIEITSEGCADLGEFILNYVTTDDSQIAVFSNTDDSARLVIDLAYLGGKDGISGGSIEIGSFAVSPSRDGQISIDPEKTAFRDIDNSDISINGLDMVTVGK